MEKLIRGIVDFRKNLNPDSRALFARLALGQKPDALFVACSDSRVVPNLFASTNPGDVFVLRNVGNLIPPSSFLEDRSAAAAIEFAVLTLNVADIVICGHSECGAMYALLEGKADSDCSCFSSWLRYGKKSLEKVKAGLKITPNLSEANQLSQINVLQQMEHVASYPFVKERLELGKLRIQGWWFDIAQADVYCYEPTLHQFVLIDEAEAELMLERERS